MKILLQIVIVLALNSSLFAQQYVRNQNPSSHIVVGSYLDHSANLNLVYNSQMVGNTYSGNEDLRRVEFNFSANQLSQFNDTLLIPDHLSKLIQVQKINSSMYYKTGPYDDSASFGRSTIWYKVGALDDFDSVKTFPLLDSNFRNFVVTHTIQKASTIYIFGGYTITQYPYYKSFVLKHNLVNNNWSMNSFFCYSSICFFLDAIYDSTQHNFVVTGTAKVGDTIPPPHAAIVKIDTNLNIVPNSPEVLESYYPTHRLATPNKYEWQAEIEPVSNNTFLTVGSALNFMQLPSQTPNPNSHYWLDMAVGLRSMGNLHEIGPAYAYGKIDSSENSAVGELPFKKVENDLYYLGATSRFSGTPPEPWDTELALFALNNNGEKHWEYYLPLNDYCYIQDLHASPSGGMWFVAQCSENYNTSTGSYDYFTKVGYVDSTYYWPRIGAVGIESPRKKAEEIQVYPNPAIDKLKVKQYGLIQALKYSLYDLQGRLVLQKRVSSHLSQLDVSSLKKAMYLLRVEDEKGRLVKEVKVVKQ